MIDWRSAVALVWAIGGWFVAAVFLGASGAVHKSPLLLLGAMTVPIIVFLILCSFLSSLQQAMTALPTEVYVLANGARVLAGLYLIDSGTGLPSEWAVPAAGLGIAIGISAIPLGLFALPADDIPKKTLLILWNVVATLEALAIPLIGVILAFSSPGSMLSLMRMPAFLMPAFVMPLMFWCHIQISSRLWRGF